MKMRKTGILSALLALAALAGCGGDDSFGTPPAGGTGTGTVSSVTVITDAPSIPSSGTTPANISALVRNSSNQFVKGVPVLFSTTSGGIGVINAVTDDNGIAKATLSSPGDKTITVTATVGGGVSGQVTVAVTGTTLTIQGPDALITSTPGNYEVVLVDSANNAVAGQVVALATQPASTLNPSSVTTDSNGRAAFTMAPTSGTSVRITATGTGTAYTKTVTVSADNFTFTSPAADSQFGLAPAVATLATTWSSGGSPVNAGSVTFSTTRGTFTSAATVTPVNGQASVSLNSTTAGEAVVTATNSNGGTTQRRIVFVASNPAQIDVQANPFTVAINQTSTITAVVRDANNNLVAGQNVVFSLVDPTGGSLSVGSAVTDLQGRASSVYRASSTASASNGVHVTASVGVSVNDTVDLTVAGSALFLSFGTGNTIEEVNNDTQYKLNYTVQVTDSTGAGVSGVTVSLSALSWDYMKGHRVPGTSDWTTQINAVCINEDRITGNPAFDFNGILDPGENQNGVNNSGVVSMEAGNIATVTPGTGTTDSNGFLQFSVYYPQDHAYYLSLVLRARTAVQGTEFARTTLPFLLPGISTDFNNLNKAPPGPFSPFGDASSCSIFN
jgi:Bacterial Ig-like domain (group 1)